MPFFSNKYKLGLDIGSSLIKVCLPSSKGRPLIMRLETPPDVVNKGVLQSAEGISDFLGQWIKKNQLEHHYVVATLPASTLVLRHIQLPRMKAKDTAEAVEWEARRVLPFALEEAQVDWVTHNINVTEEGEMQDILLVAVRDAIVERYAQAIKDAGMKLLALDIAPMALGRWLLKGVQDTSLIIDMGAETTQVHFYNGNKLIFSRSLSIGGVEATRAIVTIKACDFQEAETSKLRGEYREEWLDAWFRELGRELQRSLDYFRTNFAEETNVNFSRVILTGGASLTRGVSSLIKDATGVEPGFAEFSSKERSPRHDKIMYNVALGAGMWEGR
jgi:type IV pilus assembly protein PilM